MKPLFDTAAPAVQTAQPSDFNQLLRQAPAPTNAMVPTVKTPPPSSKKYTMNDIDAIGSSTELRIGATTRKILDNVKTAQGGEVGAKLNTLIATTKELNPKTIGKQGTLQKLFHLGGSMKERMMSEFQSVSGRIDTLVTELDKTADNAKMRADQCDVLFEENFQTWKQLGEEAIVLNQIIGDLQAQIASMPAAATGFDAQHKTDLESMVKRAQKRVDDFGRGQTLTLLAAPDIRALQEGMRTLATTIRDLKVTTIPAYTAAFGRYIIAQELKQGANLANAVADATNEALRAGADAMLDATVATAQAQQRGIVDADTVSYMQDKLVERIEAAHKIEQDGIAARLAAEPTFKKVEQYLISLSLPK